MMHGQDELEPAVKTTDTPNAHAELSRCEAFIYRKSIERQRRWYEHDGKGTMKRDCHNRFIPTPEVRTGCAERGHAPYSSPP